VVSSGVLKDYLRELPEPLFTKCLYQMMVDALSVCLPDDPEGNSKLMFSILDCLPKVNRVSITTQLWYIKHRTHPKASLMFSMPFKFTRFCTVSFLIEIPSMYYI
jgi:hypothetical protein